MSIYKITPELQIRFDIVQTDTGDPDLRNDYHFLQQVQSGKLWKIICTVLERENTDEGWSDWRKYSMFRRFIVSENEPTRGEVKNVISRVANDFKLDLQVHRNRKNEDNPNIISAGIINYTDSDTF